MTALTPTAARAIFTASCRADRLVRGMSRFEGMASEEEARALLARAEALLDGARAVLAAHGVDVAPLARQRCTCTATATRAAGALRSLQGYIALPLSQWPEWHGVVSAAATGIADAVEALRLPVGRLRETPLSGLARAEAILAARA